ncbi:MAG: hypothetical protein KatS3mg042_1698 [Rhodothermaceae bacterium]|nr:MAG: hypothetical protein KatS3mg042_1698 [Rhodothermaceae bacterium]
MREFISVEEARALVLEAVAAQPVERVALAQAYGRTLAEPVVSREHIPPFDNAAMDGFAVRSADLATLPASLRVVEDVRAGGMPFARRRAGHVRAHHDRGPRAGGGGHGRAGGVDGGR